MQKDPLTGLERLVKLLPPEPAEAAGDINIGAMFLQAVKLANGHGEPGMRTIEADAAPVLINNASKDEW